MMTNVFNNQDFKNDIALKNNDFLTFLKNMIFKLKFDQGFLKNGTS